MTGVTAFIYHPDYLKYQFGSNHPFKSVRVKYTLDLLQELNVFDGKVKYFEPKPALEEDLLSAHSIEYVKFVKQMCEKGSGLLDHGDTPATKGLYEGACSIVGGSILGAQLIMEGRVNHAVNLGGGLHHAKRERASGFCVFNDIAVTVKFLQKNYNLKRIAIIDVDGHHGDGTQEILYNEPILKISTHRVGIFPGTGYVDEIGVGAGEGYSINIPLLGETNDKSYLYAFNEVVLPIIERYRPDFIINQFGADGHYQDPLVGLALTTKTYEEVSKEIHKLANKFSNGRLLILGGGGYNVNNTVRCWAIMSMTVSDTHIDETNKYRKLLDKESPIINGISDSVKKTVEEIKKKIFPLHNL